MKKITYILLLVVLTAISCTKLDMDPKSQLTDQNAYQTKSDLLGGLSGVYSTAGCYMDGLFKVNEACTDEAVVPARGGDWKSIDLQSLHKHTWTVENGEINNAYNNLSSGIAQANLFIKALRGSGLTGTDVDIIEAEARFVRAFHYYNMIDMFGNVPIITDVVDPSNPPANNTRAQVFTFLETELKEIAAILPATSDIGRVNVNAANFLLAKVYINAKVFTGTAQWDKSIEYCNKIIDAGVYHLADDYKSIFNYDNDNSPENIYAFRDNASTSTWGSGYYIHFFTLHYSQGPQFGLTSGGWNGFSTTKSFYEKFTPTDKRNYIFLVGQQLGPNGEILYCRDGVTPLIFTPEYTTAEGIDNAAETDGARVLKYIPGGAGPLYFLNNDFAIFRYADVVLMKAEAILNGGVDPKGATALALVNSVRARAFESGDPLRALPSVDLNILLDERGREFTWELLRRNDLIRFGKFTAAWDMKGVSEPFRALFPIPSQQIGANKNLKQNDGYN
ncbi:MAG: RagB/SusD family nutrient uptake outer membrane protein [Bacteroidales bacterium]